MRVDDDVSSRRTGPRLGPREPPLMAYDPLARACGSRGTGVPYRPSRTASSSPAALSPAAPLRNASVRPPRSWSVRVA
jgi:hypothetical protein